MRWTRLTRARIRAGVTQAELAEAVGVSAKTIHRLELKWPDCDPGVRLLHNISVALDVPLLKLCEPSWLTWNNLNEKTPKPPGKNFRKPGKLDRPLWREQREWIPPGVKATPPGLDDDDDEAAMSDEDI
ncbi:MAG TPA: helix-turn-helix transcriptional regulator [Gaiellaceae bacterium]|nr:helix-turn-helix transcriptional regulator [Gaiellaceae bacterium]